MGVDVVEHLPHPRPRATTLLLADPPSRHVDFLFLVVILLDGTAAVVAVLLDDGKLGQRISHSMPYRVGPRKTRLTPHNCIISSSDRVK